MATYNNVYRALEGEIVVETSKAILFKIINTIDNSTIKQDWFPKSQLSSFGGKYDEIDGTFQYILVTEWLLGQKGLLSSSKDKALVKTNHMDITSPVLRKAAKELPHSVLYGLNQSGKEVKGRAELKDDESSFDDYYQGLMNEDAGDKE